MIHYFLLSLVVVFVLPKLFTQMADAQAESADWHQHPTPSDPLMEQAVSMLDDGEVAGLKALLAKHPQLVHEQATGNKAYDQGYFKSPTLLHFVAANPNFTGEALPKNWLEIASVILDAGAKVDAGCGDDGKGTTLGLVASSRLLHFNDLQLDMIKLLVDRGADPQRAVDAALAHPNRSVLKALVDAGAKQTLPIMAGLNRWLEIKRIVHGEKVEQAILQKALMVSANFGHDKPVFYLTSIDYGLADPSCYGPAGFFEYCTPLHQAAVRGHLETVEKLIHHDADPSIKDKNFDGTPRDWAVHDGNQQAVVELLDQLEDYMPIVRAARVGDLQTLDKLLDAKPHWLDKPIPNGSTLLFDLCNINTRLKNVGKTIAYLIKRGANPNQTNNPDGTGETPLHWAASFGPNIKHGPEAINALLDNGANIYATGSVLGNGTPVVNAVIFRDVSSARLLIDRGAKFDLGLAAGAGWLDLVKTFFNEQGQFHNPHGDMPHRDSTTNPETELHMAICVAGINGQRDCMAFLLEQGAPINAVSVVGTTPLDELLNSKFLDTAKWLKEQGALTAAQLKAKVGE